MTKEATDINKQTNSMPTVTCCLFLFSPARLFTFPAQHTRARGDF